MSTPSPTDRLLRIFRAAADSQPIPPGPHCAEDEELLTCWSLGQIRPDQHAAILEHLADCPKCRHELAAMIRAGVFEPSRPMLVAPSRGRAILAWGGGLLAAAAAVVFCLSVFGPGWKSESVLARAERELNRGQAAAALDGAGQVLTMDRDPRRRRQAERLLEQAGYRLARAELDRGHFDQVEAIERRVAGHGVSSWRLQNLGLQAERRMPAENALAYAGSLTDYGYGLDGLNDTKAIPQIDQNTERLDRQWTQAVADHPGDPTLLINYGQFLLTQARYDQAREQFQAAVRVDERRAPARLGLGLVAYALRQYPAALQQFQAAAELDPNSAAAQLNLAICLERLGHPEEARPRWRRAAELTASPALRQQIEEHQKKLERARRGD